MLARRLESRTEEHAYFGKAHSQQFHLLARHADSKSSVPGSLADYIHYSGFQRPRSQVSVGTEPSVLEILQRFCRQLEDCSL